MRSLVRCIALWAAVATAAFGQGYPNTDSGMRVMLLSVLSVDKRDCLKLATPAEVIKCTERK